MGTYRVNRIVEAEPQALDSAALPTILFSLVVGGAMVWWAANAEVDRINQKLLRLLQRSTTGRWSGEELPEVIADIRELRDSPIISDQARKALVSVSKSLMPSAVETLRVQETPALPAEIMGIPVGTRSEVSREIPPVGATLPATDVIEGYLGGQRPSGMSKAETEKVASYPPDQDDVSTMHRVITQFAQDITEERPDLKYGGNIVTDVGLTEWNLKIVAEKYGEKHNLDTIDAMSEVKNRGLLDDPEMYDEVYRASVKEQLLEHLFDSFEEYFMPFEYSTISSPAGVGYDYKLTLEGSYFGSLWNLYITNKRTLRSYVVSDLDEMTISYLKEGAISASDIKPENVYLLDPIAAQSKVDREVAVAAAQFINWAEPPGNEPSLEAEHMEATRLCTAWACYRITRSIMDATLAINKADCDSEEMETTPDMTECDWLDDSFMDYCCEFKQAIEKATEEKLEMKTWTEGSPWFVDVCGVHIEVDGEWYTVPPDNVLEYKWNKDITPKYLPGIVCPAFAVVTPATQREMEARILERRDLLEKAEPWVVVGALINLYKKQDQEKLIEFVEMAHAGTVVNAFKHAMEQRWFSLHSFREDVNVSGVNYKVGTGYSKEFDALSVSWTEGQEIDRGEYVVDGPTFARYLYDVAQGRPRNSVTFRSL